MLPTPRKNLSEAQTAELIKVAALPPWRKLQAYKAVIQRVLSPWSLFKQWGVSVGSSFMQVRGSTWLWSPSTPKGEHPSSVREGLNCVCNTAWLYASRLCQVVS